MTNGEPAFDYIIVGSGAGGGPLAARLALDERNPSVLVIEAGSDPRQATNAAPEREVTQVPSLHGVSTEHPDVSWQFFVDHYERPPAGPDPKRVQEPGHRGEGKIFYPRASGIGGCTIHNAMITIAGPGADWDELADFLGDRSWRAETMRPYFQRLERNEYYDEPSRAARAPLGRLVDNLAWLVGFPRDRTRGRHGFGGWLHTSVTDIALGLRDTQLVKMLKAALRQSRRARLDRGWTLVRRFLKGRITEALDPNHFRTQQESPEGVVLVPLAVCGDTTTIHKNSSTPWVQRGRRSSPREFLFQAKAAKPDNLTIWTDCLVTRVIFEKTGKSKKPRAVGVEYRRGAKLYRAHVTPSADDGERHVVRVKAGGEVILAGGAFNTPQLLMLSGIGDRAHLATHEISGLVDADGQTVGDIVDLPGVGCNLQDRYEVTLVSEMKKDFSLLDGATFRLPEDDASPDPHLAQWRKEGTGLYTSNGAVLGIFKRSRPDVEKPDLFIFGIPLPFLGYELGYSAAGHVHDQFTWAILKAQTRNRDGVVRLRSTDPRDTPDINFHYFNERSRPGESDRDPDLLALLDGVKFVRGITRRAKYVVRNERHPGLAAVPTESDDEIKRWIRRDAWGHHACGTCRMGPDGDEAAVLDSRFRVRRVRGLRVVDASIFPRIPGYFIVTEIYMASEKAADVILEDARGGRGSAATYPAELETREARALVERRKQAGQPEQVQEDGGWSDQVTGIGLSGGGIRSATFNLGVLQSFAAAGHLPRVDFLSTVSGGGYVGSHLGRLYDRLRDSRCRTGKPPHQIVQAALIEPQSPALRWLRRQGNYISPNGSGDVLVNFGTYLRNLLSMHFVVGMLVFAVLGVANLVRYAALDTGLGLANFAVSPSDLPVGALLHAVLGPFFSPWFILFELVVLFFVLPRIIGYWLASQDRHERYAFPALLLNFVLIAVLLAIGVRDGRTLPALVLALSLLTAFVCVEQAWRRGRRREAAVGSGGDRTRRLRTRNFLTYDLGLWCGIAGLAVAFALIDSIAHALQQVVAGNRVYATAFGVIGTTLVAGIPVLRFLTGFFARGESSKRTPGLVRMLKRNAVAGLLALTLLVVPLVAYSFTAHAAYGGGTSLGRGAAVTGLALVISAIFALPWALPFANRSSLAQTYAARLARAFLGASNPLRHRARGSDVTEVMPDDDVASIRDYRPHERGGPLHLINAVVNQTVDFTSLRGNRDRKGENVAVSALGLSVGRQWHSRWADPAAERGRPVPPGRARLVPVGKRPGTDHPLVERRGDAEEATNRAEALSLGRWMSISGAAVAPGAGQTTQLGTALLFGMANFRTGWWWNSGITLADRDGLRPLTLVRRLLYLLPRVFLVQSLLIMEWIARFPGPWVHYWYLSDGGFFENLGGYELVRRGVPRIILCDGSADPKYEMAALANFIRKVRIDFNASVESFTEAELKAAKLPSDVVPHVGTLDDLQPARDGAGNVIGSSRKHAALFRVRYADEHGKPIGESRLLYLKASRTGDESADVDAYRDRNPDFPNQSTGDQVFDEEQWESYRKLGEHIGTPLFTSDWFWKL